LLFRQILQVSGTANKSLDMRERTATISSRCFLNSELRVFDFAPRQLRRRAFSVSYGNVVAGISPNRKPRNCAAEYPLYFSITKELRTHRKIQGEERLKLGVAWQEYDLVFPSEIGTPLNAPNITKAFEKILEKARIRNSIRLYNLRHIYVTLLLLADVNPKFVSERLGHSSITLTLDVYSHVLPGIQEAATEHLETMIFSKFGTL
jgi:hypothetical protein